MTSRMRHAYVMFLEALDRAPRLTRGMTVASSLLLGAGTGAVAFGLYAAFPPVNEVGYLLTMLAAFLPLMAVMSLKLGGWLRWHRIPAVLFIWFVTDTFALPVMMVCSMIWLWWRVLFADKTVWRFRRGIEGM